MKRALLTVLAMTMLIALTACNGKTQQVQETQPASETAQKPIGSPEDVISTVLTDYTKVFEETREGLIANNGQSIGTESDVREVSDEGIVFSAGNGENPMISFAKGLDEEDNATKNQAFYMKFKPSQKDFGFIMSAEGNAGITIGEENEPVLFVANHDYMEPIEGGLKIEPDNWYHVLLAMGSDGLMQGAIWKDGQENNPAYLNLHIGQSFGDRAYENQSWKMSFGFKGEATFTVDNYAYYYFDNFCMPDRVIEMDSSEHNEGSIQMPQSKEDVLFSMLKNPQELWSEGSQGFSENNGGEFGGGVKMGYNADMQRLEIFGEENGACAKFNTSLMTCMSDVGMDKVPQQAVIVKFSASDITEARVSFEALDEIDFWFEDSGVKFVDVANFFEMPISDFMPNNFELKNDTIYYFFFAFDEKGNIRMFVWEDGLSENQAYFEYDLYQDAADINNCDLIMHLAVGANEQFNLYEYGIYTFESFMDTPNYIAAGDNSNNDAQNDENDYGPYWTINIAGNFDIMSDMVWQSVEGCAFEVNGDTYVGYNLSEMMEFSGNASDTAQVVFGDPNGSDVEVNPTNEAFIVFKRNDAFLGGRFYW